MVTNEGYEIVAPGQVPQATPDEAKPEEAW